MFKSFKHPKVFLGIIFIFALLLRLYQLPEIPNGFHTDEVSNGYIGRYILLNGHDLDNRSFPLDYSNKFGDYPPVIPMYFSGISTFIFGVNEFAVRFPSALFGALLVFPTFLLIKELTGQKKPALIASLLLCTLPWSLVLSRTTSEVTYGLFFFMMGIIFLVRGLKSQHPWKIVISLLIFLFLYLIYPTFRTLIPMLLFFAVFVSDHKTRKFVLGGLIISLICTVLVSTTIWGKARFNAISIFNHDVELSLQKKSLELSYAGGPNNVFASRFFHNKQVLLAEQFIRNYSDYFSPGFLLFNGGPPDRNVVPNRGVISIFLAAIILFGFLFPSEKFIKNKYSYLFIGLLFASIIPAALTIDEIPNTNRSAVMIVPLIILTGLSCAVILKTVSKLNFKYESPVKVVLFLGIGVFFAAELLFFLHYYFVNSLSYRSLARNDGEKQLAEFLIAQNKEGNKVLSTGTNWEGLYYLFFSNNFSSHISPLKIKLFRSDIDNIHFTRAECPTNEVKSSVIKKYDYLVQYANCKQQAGDVVLILTRKDQTGAYEVVKIKK